MFLQTRQPTEALQWSGVTGRVRCGNRSSLLRFDFRDKNNHNQQCMKKNKKKNSCSVQPPKVFLLALGTLLTSGGCLAAFRIMQGLEKPDLCWVQEYWCVRGRG